MLLGGLSGVRGHQAGAASVDEGHLIQTEFKHYLPVFSQSVLVSSLFYDYGLGKYYKNSQSLAQSVKNNVKLQSVGAGLSLQMLAAMPSTSVSPSRLITILIMPINTNFGFL